MLRRDIGFSKVSKILLTLCGSGQTFQVRLLNYLEWRAQ
jgi:hypothetical protein